MPVKSGFTMSEKEARIIVKQIDLLTNKLQKLKARFPSTGSTLAAAVFNPRSKGKKK